ncbi:MAG: DUF342 domain-containing protein [Cellulosilyticaceae bacterium]
MPNQIVKDEQLIIETSKDKMYGIISYIAPENGGQLVSFESIKSQLVSKGIVFGIEEHAIRESLENKRYGYKYIVARGKMSVPGEPATLTYGFDIESIGKRTPKKKEDGTVDFKELGLVVNTTAGTMLATKKAATEGQNGCNVLGKTIVAPKGKDIRMPKGKNTALSADGLVLTATIDGQIEYNGESIAISPHYIIGTDVDSSVGNVNFVGNIIVNGGVHSGYTIQSGGNVEVRGPVEAATIIAEGDIVLWYGIQGADKGKLIAKGNIITKFIQNATVHANQDVVAEVIMHSEVGAGGNVMVDQGKGLIVGGSITAGKGIYTNTLGSYMATVTSVQLGQSPQLMDQYKKLEHHYLELRDKCFKTDQNISFLKVKGIKGLTPDKQKLFEQMLTLQENLKNELETVQRQYFELRDTIKDTDIGMIKVRNSVYQGVRVTIGNAVKYFVEESKFCSISKQNGEIYIGMY